VCILLVLNTYVYHNAQFKKHRIAQQFDTKVYKNIARLLHVSIIFREVQTKKHEALATMSYIRSCRINKKHTYTHTHTHTR